MDKQIVLDHDWLDNQQRMYLGKNILQYLVDHGIHADTFSYAIVIRYSEDKDPQSGDDRTQNGDANAES
jgi:hypothetical protein